MIGFIIQTAGRVLFYPRKMCERIPCERSSSQLIFTYIGVLALIPSIAKLLELSLVPAVVNGAQPLRLVITAKGILVSVLYLCLILIAAAAMAYLYFKLSARFGGKPDYVSSLKVVGYALTPMLVSPLFGWIPYASAILSILAIVYAFYILGLGILFGLQPRREVRFFLILACFLTMVFFLMLVEFAITSL